jgi:hypothetical protein
MTLCIVIDHSAMIHGGKIMAVRVDRRRRSAGGNQSVGNQSVGNQSVGNQSVDALAGCHIRIDTNMSTPHGNERPIHRFAQGPGGPREAGRRSGVADLRP